MAPSKCASSCCCRQPVQYVNIIVPLTLHLFGPEACGGRSTRSLWILKLHVPDGTLVRVRMAGLTPCCYAQIAMPRGTCSGGVLGLGSCVLHQTVRKRRHVATSSASALSAGMPLQRLPPGRKRVSYPTESPGFIPSLTQYRYGHLTCRREGEGATTANDSVLALQDHTWFARCRAPAVIVRRFTCACTDNWIPWARSLVAYDNVQHMQVSGTARKLQANGREGRNKSATIYRMHRQTRLKLQGTACMLVRDV
jgi:hypothetical protein